VLIPIALAWLLLLGALQLARDDILTIVDNDQANLAIVIGIAFVILLVAGSLLASAIAAGRASRDESMEAYD
jgi:predicted Na+-dependent transporter